MITARRPAATRSGVRRLSTDTRGVGLIEFAFALPVLLTLVLGGLEIANLALMQQHVTEMASQVAQNAARGTQQMDEADIAQIFTGSELSAAGTTLLTNGRLILSSVRLNAAGNGQWIEWQRCTGGVTTIRSAYGAQGKGKTDTSLQRVGAAPGLQAAANVDIMVVEVQTTYQPLLGSVFSIVSRDKTLRAVNAQVVRDRTTFNLKNDGGLTAAQIRTC